MQDSRPSGGHFAVTDNLSVVRVAGDDAAAFLHGQLTCDVKALQPDTHTLGGWCNAQGRLLAVLNVFRQADAFLLTLPRELAETLVTRLRMFVLRAKVTIERADETFAIVAAAGFDPGPDIRNLCVAVMQVASKPVPYFHLIGRAEKIAAITASLASVAKGADSAARPCFDIAAALPSVHPKTSGEFVPQMLNLDLLGGVSFNKGCYPGQEIVARLHFRGGLKGRMIRARVAAEGQELAPGDPVYFPAESGDQTVGRIVTAGHCGAHETDVLAVVPLAALPDGILRVGNPTTGPLLVPGEMPYSLPRT
jgi:folate-binding protein YgfZ